MRRALLPCLLAACSAFAAAPPAPVSPAVLKLIDQLGDDDEDSRKEAQKKLEALGEDVIGPLRRASKSHADVDVKLKAGVLAAAIEKKLFGEIRSYKASGWVCRCVVTPDGKKVIGNGDFLRVYDLETGKMLREFAANSYPWGLSVSRDGKHVLTSHGDRSVRLYELETGKEVHKFVKHTGEVWLAALSPDGKLAVTGGFDLAVHVWDTKTGNLLRSFENVTDYPRCGTFSPDGKHIAIGHYTGGQFQTSPATVRVWDVQTGKLVRSSQTLHAGAITAVVWSPDGKRIASSSFDKTVRLWGGKTLKHEQKLTVSDQGSDGVVFTRDGRRLVTAGWGSDTSLRVFDIVSGRELRRYDGHAGSVLCLAAAPDGRRVVSAGTDGTLRLWPLPR